MTTRANSTPESYVHFADDGGTIKGYAQVHRFVAPFCNGVDNYHPCNEVTVPGAAYGTAALAVDTMYFLPLLISKRCYIGHIGVAVSVAGGAGSKYRLAIYDSLSDEDIGPGVLLWASAEIDGTVAAPNFQRQAVSLKAYPSDRLWAAYFCGVAAPTVEVWPTTAGQIQIGVASTDLAGAPPHSRNCMLTVATPYGAFPPTAPTTGVRAGTAANTVPVLWTHFHTPANVG